MPFDPKVKDEALVACQRCCCICHKFCGTKIEVAHIRAEGEGGADTFDNAIPLCFDCHADMRSYDFRHPKGNKYSESELVRHRDGWYRKVSENAGVADRATAAHADAVLEFGAATVAKVPQVTDPTGEREVAFRPKLTVTNLGPGTVRNAQVRHWSPGLNGDPVPVPLPLDTLHEGTPTEFAISETVWALRPVRANVLVYQTGWERAIRSQVKRRLEEGALLEYSCACQVVADRGRSPLLAVRFLSPLGPDGVWCEPVVEQEEIAEDEVLAHCYLR